jgi:hypothetical protein
MTRRTLPTATAGSPAIRRVVGAPGLLARAAGPREPIPRRMQEALEHAMRAPDVKAKITEPNSDEQACSPGALARVAATGIERLGWMMRANTVLAGR